MIEFVKFSLRIVVYFFFVQLFDFAFLAGHLYAEKNSQNIIFAVICLIIGILISLFLANVLAKRAGRNWSSNVARYGESNAVARGRMVCELIALIGILSSLPLAYRFGGVFYGNFIAPILYGMISYLFFVLIVLGVYGITFRRNQ